MINKIIPRGRVAASIAGKRLYQLAHKGMGYMPADRKIFPNLTVRQNLEIARTLGTSVLNYEH